jgi:hypothetical protein
LTRHCTDEYYGWKGPCCKVDEMFNYIINENPELFAQTKYLLHADDDTYFRADQILRYLAAIENSGLAHLPIVGNSSPTKEDHGIWHIKGCTEIRATGWYQPMMFNKAAMEKMKLASAAHGLMDTCRNFDVTHDVGVEAYVWFFGLYHIFIPRIEINGEHKGNEVFQPDLMIVHALKHDNDHCAESQEGTWPDKDKYDQKLVIGCGDIDHHGPFHDAKKQADMYDAYEYFRDHGKDTEVGIHGKYEWHRANVTLDSSVPAVGGKFKIKEILPKDAKIENGMYKGETVTEKVIPNLQLIDGYDKSKHAKHHDIINKEWKEFTLKDCSPPAVIG